MEISAYSTIDFSKARNLLTERQKNVKAFNPIVPEGGCISLLELNPKQYDSIKWFFINQKTGKITETTAESSDGMHYVAIPEGLSLGTYRLKIETRHSVGDITINETTISNPFEYVEASEDVVTIVSRNADNNLVGNLRKNATIIQPIYTNPPSGGVGGSLDKTFQTLTEDATITFDASVSVNGSVTLTASRMLGNISNAVAGEVHCVKVIQGGSGGYALTYDNQYKFPGGVVPTLSATVGAVDLLFFLAVSTSEFHFINAIFDLQTP